MKAERFNDKRVLVVDMGMFTSWAHRLAREFGEVYYHNPSWKSLSPSSNQLLIGHGFDEIAMVKNLWDVVHKMDLIIFPYIYDGDLQTELVRQGKRVWGGRKGDELEIYRPEAKKEMERLGMPVGEYDVVTGLEALRSYLRKHKNVHVKVSLTRGDCFDPQTELMTKRGWVKFPDVKEDDFAITMCPNNRKAKFVRVSNVIKKWHSGTMIRVLSDSVDALVTPNHHFWTRSRNNAPYKYTSVSEMEGKTYSIPQAFAWSGRKQSTFCLKNAFGNQSLKADRIFDMDDWCSLMGWFVSEGSLSVAKVKKIYRVGVSQSVVAKPENYNEILNLLVRMGFNPQVETDRGFSVYDKALFKELERTCYSQSDCEFCGKKLCSHNKRVPAYLKALSPDKISSFLKAYGKGDGSQEKRSYGQMKYYTSSISLANDVQELVFKTGRVASLRKSAHVGELGGVNQRGVQIIARAPGYSVNVLGERRDATIYPHMVTKEFYEGWVYDVTVDPWHTIFVRRNGVAYWSGNSETFHSPSYEEIIPKLDEIKHFVGAAADSMQFVIEQPIDPALEIGYDGFTIDGQFPGHAINGVEVKDSSYIGTILPYADLDKSVRRVNEWLAPALKDYQYRGLFSTEVRVGPDEQPYLIDVTARGGSPPSESMQELIANWAEIMWYGAAGKMVDPIPDEKYSAQAVIYSDHADEAWQPIDIPDEVRRWVKLFFHCRMDGVDYVIPQPAKFSEIGWVVGTGKTIKEAIKNCEDHAEQISGYKLEVRTGSLQDAISEIEKGQEMGIQFSDEPLKV